MELPKGFRIEFKDPTAIEYNKIRNTTNWDKFDLVTIEKGLKKSLFSVCIYDIDKLIGIGRIVGDGSIYFYIQDIIVIPKYQRKGFGKIIMTEIMRYLDNNANNNSFIGLMAADGVEEFYHNFGFKTRAKSRPGMYFVYKKKKNLKNNCFMKIIIRELKQIDCKIMTNAFKEQNWNKSEQQFNRYLKEQSLGQLDVLVAFINSDFAGFVTIKWNSSYPLFKFDSIPEITDLNVLKKHQRKGIATKLLNRAEEIITKKSEYAGIGVGLTEDYGIAHKLYIKRGYIPDGKGISYNRKFLEYGDKIKINDNLAIYFLKKVN